MHLVENITPTVWNDWFSHQIENPPLTAHAAWGNLLAQENIHVEYFLIQENEEIIGGFSLITYERPKYFRYGYSPKGPFFKNGFTNVSKAYQLISDRLQKKGYLAWRIEPTTQAEFSTLPHRKVTDVQPATTLLLDLNLSSEELLSQMHTKTRYNIRLAQKKDLEIRWEKNPELFWQLSLETSGRDGFRLHPYQHYKNLIMSPFAEHCTIYHENRPIASAVFTYLGNTFTYLYGASRYEDRALMAPYLIQWTGIERGKNQGARWYDFYGLAPLLEPASEQKLLLATDYSYHPAAKESGYTRFKLGFGGKIEVTPGTWDIILSPFKYHLFQLLRTAMRIIRKIRL